jgi:hypothetical protein
MEFFAAQPSECAGAGRSNPALSDGVAWAARLGSPALAPKGGGKLIGRSSRFI